MPRRNFAKLQKIKINKKRGQPTVSSFFNKISKPKEQSPAILNDPEANEESDVTENAFLAPKRQKYSSNTGELSGEKSQETKTPAISLSSKTLEKIKYFSAHHDASTSYEKMEYDDLGRKNEEDGKKNKIKLVDNHYSEHCLTASSFIETNNLSSAYNQSPRSPTKSCTTTSSGTNMKYTPLEQQVLELKRKHGGMILMIQTAYKYTFFGEDAEVASRVLNIMVTQHHNFLTAVIPTVRLHVHIRRLVEEGYKVGVVNQTETAAMKAAGENKNTPFTRELANVYTKATLIGDDVDPLSQEGEFIQGGNFASYIMCIAESPDTVPNSQPKSANLAIVAFDPSTGDTVYDSFEDGPCREELERRFEHLDPAEIIVPQTISQETERLVKHSSARLETLEDGVFNFTGALVQVADFFCAQEDSESNSQKLNSMSDLPPLTVVCLSALIHHLKQFGLARALRSNSLRHFTSDSRYVKMDATVLRNLEIFKSGLGTHKGSLIWALDHTRTKFGSRLLHDWVSQPVRDLAILQSRQEAITELLQSESAVVQQLEKILDGIPDIDRGLTTCIHQRIGPPSLCAVLRTLGKLQTDLESVCDFVDADLKSPLLQDLIKDALFNLSNIGPFLQNLNQQAARDGDKTKLLHDYSAFPSVMKRIDEISSVTKQLDNLKPAIARKLGLLKFDYITVSGQEFLIEVKQNQKKSVPNSWRKISETKQAIRYRSPEVDSLYREMSHLREQLINDCHSAWLLFLSDFNAHYFAHKRAIKNLATLDVLFSLVQVAKQDGYCRPTLLDSEETIIDIEKGRHPVIPLLFTSTEQFVSNNTRLKSDEECCMILSGPNMGGKSCYIRQVALIAIMAHIGSYVPAECATISILDSVFTRMGARDELFQGRSTLMLELEEASVILRRATCKSLVLLDELGRGTSSCDGTSIAIATLHHLLTEVRCLILFVTHYPAVMELENQYVGKARNYHMAFILHNKDGGSEEILTFLYEVTCGSAGRSYGLNVARLANVPQCLLQRASEKAQMLESWTVSKRCALQQFKQLWQSANLNYPSK